MTFKVKTTVLVSLIAALSLSLGIGHFSSLGGAWSRSPDIPLLTLLKTGNPREIVMAGKNGETRLRKDRDADWAVLIEEVPFPADKGKIDRFLEILGKGKILRTATDKEELWETFEVGDTGLPQMTLTGGAGKAQIIVGKPGEVGTEQYIRIKGDKKVFLLSEGLSFYADQGKPYWSDLRLFPRGLEGRALAAVSVKGAIRRKEGPESVDYKLVREKKEGGTLLWSADGRPELRIKQNLADNLANALAGLTAAEFVPPSRKSGKGLGRGDLVIEFSASDGRTFTLEIGNGADEKDWYCSAAVDGKPLPHEYLLGGPAFQRVAKSLKEMTEEAENTGSLPKKAE